MSDSNASQNPEAAGTAAADQSAINPGEMLKSATKMAEAEPGVAAGTTAMKIQETHQEAAAVKAKAKAEYDAQVASTEGMSKVTSKKVEERAAKAMQEEEEKAAAMLKKLTTEQQKRIEENKKQAAEYKAKAIEVETKLKAIKVKKIWGNQSRVGEERVFETDAQTAVPDQATCYVPKTKKEALAFLQKYQDQDSITPYEGAFMFLVALYRLTNVRGGKERMVTLDMFLEVMHPDCFHEKGGELKIRKHTRMNLNRCSGETARSYFKGSSAFNKYEVDEGKPMVVTMISGEGYNNEVGAVFTVNVKTSGSAHPGNCMRGIDMKCVKDDADGKIKWKARDIQGLLANVVEPFNPAGAETQEEMDRERKYRENFQLPPPKGFVPREGEVGYQAPKKDAPGLEKVDLEATRRKIREREEEERLAKLPQEERDRILQERHDRRQAKAKERTAKLAAGGGGGADDE